MLRDVLQVLVDADNVAQRRLQPVLDLLAELAPSGDSALRLTASGRPLALARLSWPAGSDVQPHEGWQRADVAGAEAYTPGEDALVIISGDGDFGLLAARHPGPVLVISGAPSNRLRDSATVVDPAVEGVGPIRAWLAAQGMRAGDRPAG
jgi:hypothetical protein